jgi:hypothetical protein
MNAAFAAFRLISMANRLQGCVPLTNALSQINCTAARKITIVTKEDCAQTRNDEGMMSYSLVPKDSNLWGKTESAHVVVSRTVCHSHGTRFHRPMNAE